ncbi:hypothetical protein FRX31_014668 [Thalictrum thalictroides]|uniref:Uncharacterized protein n=1 Tax=Thalictrum thalictroides TaxID=46969 RepID=A0A7J6WFU7_THATH|nr:hypothetical protein FRX31_014668 [Thalictrum thalictroides]
MHEGVNVGILEYKSAEGKEVGVSSNESGQHKAKRLGFKAGSWAEESDHCIQGKHQGSIWYSLKVNSEMGAYGIHSPKKAIDRNDTLLAIMANIVENKHQGVVEQPKIQFGSFTYNDGSYKTWAGVLGRKVGGAAVWLEKEEVIETTQESKVDNEKPHDKEGSKGSFNIGSKGRNIDISVGLQGDMTSKDVLKEVNQNED